MNNAILYSLSLVILLITLLPFVLIKIFLRRRIKLTKFIKWYPRIISLITTFLFFVTIFHVEGAMKTVPVGEKSPYFDTNVGCVNLVGVPYGNNRVANFFGWLSITLFYPTSMLVILHVFYPNKVTGLLNKIVLLPISAFALIFLFHLENSLLDVDVFDYRNIFIALLVGSTLSTSIISVINDYKIKNADSCKSYFYSLFFYLICIICFLPAYTYCLLLPTDGQLLGSLETSLRVKDFTVPHRIALYITLLFPMMIYFLGKNKDKNTKTLLMVIYCFGALTVFLSAYGTFSLFSHTSSGLKINVTRLPIHLCHTALYIVPICIIFKLKKLFYFTYFINVFGALMAMFWPNVGDQRNIYDPEIIMFWYNHISAFSSPLLCVGLAIFERPKFKQVLYSLAFFFVYYVLIVILNGWLSNYVTGYNPDVIGSGTDYLFINNDYILDSVFGEESVKLLNIKVKFNIGDLVFVYYPPYQIIFFFSYIAIAFSMWYVYSLFFSISTSHYKISELLSKNRINKKLFRERINNNKDINHNLSSIKINGFYKKYNKKEDFSVKDINLDIKAGDIFGFIGPNGAGKSTCIRTIIGQQAPTKGSISIADYDIVYEAMEAKSLIGYVPDHYNLYEYLSGREYVNFVADLYRVSAKEREERIDFYAKMLELESAMDEQIKTYSHGMKQKITIIASLIHNPKVWILDEPLTGLDPQSVYQVKQCMINHAKEGNIVFFSSHIIDVVEKLCTRVALIDKGSIVFDSKMDDETNLESLYFTYIKEAKQ